MKRWRADPTEENFWGVVLAYAGVKFKTYGRFVWDEYKQLIEETEMEYSERKVKLHNVRSKMNAFIYQFSCKAEFMEDEQIGELYYIENGEAYFDENDILRRELFEEGKDLFI